MVVEVQQEQHTDLISLFPRALLYRGAVSWEVVEKLSCRGIWQDITHVLEDEAWCQSRREELSAILYTVIAGVSEEDTAWRHYLIRVKRGLYNLQARADDAGIVKISEMLEPEQSALLREYWQRVQRLKTSSAQVQTMLADNFSRARTILKETISQTPALLKGIALIAPELFAQAKWYMQTTLQAGQQKIAKEEMSLLLYLTRIATKTSIFSTFTSIAQVHIEYNDDIHCRLLIPDETQSSRVTVNHVPLILLTRALARQKQLQRYLTLYRNPYCREDHGFLSIVRVSAPEVNMRRVAYGQLETVSLAVTPAISALLRQVTEAEQKGRPHTLESLLNWLLDHLPPIPGASLRSEELLQHLLDLQVLRFEIEGLQTVTVVRDILKRLEHFPVNAELVHSQIVPALRKIEAVQQEYPQQSAEERVGTVRTVDAVLQQSLKVLDATVHPQRLQPPIYESSMLARDDLVLSWPRISGLREDFQLVVNLLPLFCPSSILQAILTSFFTHLYGQGGVAPDILQFYQEMRRQFAEDEFQLWSGAPWRQLELPESIRRFAGEAPYLIRMRNAFFLDLNRQIDELVARDRTGTPGEISNAELILDRSWLSSVARQLPPSQQSAYARYAFMCQSVPRAEGDLFVVNSITDGWGRRLGVHSANLIHGLEEWSDRKEDLITLLRHHLEQSVPPGHEFVEIATTHGFNGNIHPAVTKRVLVLPGEWTAYPVKQQLFLSDLVLAHDKERQCLRFFHKREGTEIHLLYRGSLSTGLLSPLHRWLVTFTNDAYWSDLSFTEAFMGMPGRKGQTDRVHVYPRLRLGQLVLARRKWMIPVALWPQWEGWKCLEIAQLLEIERWRRRHDLPVQVYVRPALSRRTKPQFVDFQHSLLLASLPKRLRSLDGWFKTEEALPAPAEYHQTFDGRHVVSAFWVEPC